LPSKVVPTNYAELHTLYRGYVENSVRKWGVLDPEDVADISSVILTKFIERDMLAEYDPTKGLFSTFLFGFIAAYVRYHKDRANLDRWREGTSHDVVLGNSDSTFTVYDAIAPAHVDDTTDIEYLELIRRIRAHLSTIPPTSKRDKCDLVKVFELIILHEYEYGRIHQEEIARQLGNISVNTAKAWIKRVQQHAATVVAQ
jgi:hypothetical protein